MKSILNLFNPCGVLLLGALLCSQVMAEGLPQSERSDAEKLVVEFYDRIFVKRESNIRAVSEKMLHPDYIQHNPYVATGREAFINAIGGWLKNMPATKKIEIKRVITSGDYVVLHMHSYDTSSNLPGRAGVDIFRVQNGLIMEHWDVWQTIPEKMPHDNTMF